MNQPSLGEAIEPRFVRRRVADLTETIGDVVGGLHLPTGMHWSELPGLLGRLSNLTSARSIGSG